MTISPTASEDPKKQDETECRLDAADQQAEQEVLDDPIDQARAIPAGIPLPTSAAFVPRMRGNGLGWGQYSWRARFHGDPSKFGF